MPGKFDAFHLGHAQLAKQAASLGAPTLLSFSGMSSALGWPPRAPVVAPVERARILRMWSRDLAPIVWRELPFPSVRNMSPSDFVEFLVREFGAGGIVCGNDWRFGRGATGDVSDLQALGARFGLQVDVVGPVHVEGKVVSSTRVRKALAEGDVLMARQLLGRSHRLVGFVESVGGGGVNCGCFVNQVPGDGVYDAIVRVIGREPFRGKVFVSRVGKVDPMMPVELLTNGVTVQVEDAESIYCAECEIYIDFEDRVG